ncbi:MAG: hypothetical protein KGH66_01995 [Candidatus Micrarchaeota archaeon]|nr:hypothetical protein [Candidatus Micrarchaeota archaeon]
MAPSNSNGKSYIGNPYMTKDMKRQVLKLMVLRRIRAGRAYSYAIIKELGNEHLSMFLKKDTGSVKNDVYNTINALERSGYIKFTPASKLAGGKKYCVITAQGRSVLLESKRLFIESMKELMKILG